MSSDGVGLIEAPPEQQRIVGRFGGKRPGPTMVVLGGVHGNEPSGVLAARKVLERLEREAPPLRGEVVALAGNRRALRRETRYIDKDLNRQWTDERLAAVLGAEPGAESSPEDVEQRELHSALVELVVGAKDEVLFVDLHTSSADGPPFLTIGDTLRNRRFALDFPLPVILGLEEQVDGSLLEYMNNRGCVTLGVEAGRHDLASSVDYHEAVLSLALVAAGMLEARDVPDADRYRRELAEAGRGPRIMEIRHRHATRPGDGFEMLSGFRNFQPVEEGQMLARDRDGPIHAREDGLILLPRYQGQGNDGFFIGREFRMFWLTLSALLRRLRLDGVMHLLPGVRRHPSVPGTLVVNTRIARWYPLEIFHLLGFRKLRRVGPTLLVSRRRYDLHPAPRF